MIRTKLLATVDHSMHELSSAMLRMLYNHIHMAHDQRASSKYSASQITKHGRSCIVPSIKKGATATV